MARNERALSDPEHEVFARLEAAMVGFQPLECTIINRFAPDQYIRECRIPPGGCGTSMIHTVEHVFMVLQGVVMVRDDKGRIEIISAPHVGITKAGTKRALFVPPESPEVVWVTVHPNPDNKQDVDAIVARVTAPYDNPAVPPALANAWRKNQAALTE